MRRIIVWVLAATICLGVGITWAIGPDRPPGDKPKPAGSIFEDSPELLVPKRPRSQADLNRLESLSLFAAGRMKQQQQDLPGALRLYQRALRYDPKALPILEQIVPLTFALNRPLEGVRYALMAVELDPSNEPLVRRLAAHLTEEDDLDGALKLYEKVLQLEPKEAKKKPEHVALMLELGRLYAATDQHKQAAAAFIEVTEALAHPDDFGLNARNRRELMENPAEDYQMFGDSFLAVADYDRAVAAFHKAQEAGQTVGLLAYNLSRVHRAKQEYEPALGRLQEYLGAKETGRSAEAYELLAEVLDKLGKSNELLSRLDTARAGDVDNVPLTLYLASKYRAAKEFDKAEPLYLRLHEKKRTPGTYAGLAAIYRDRKQAEPLLKLLGQSAEDNGGLESFGVEIKPLLADSKFIAAIVKVAASQREAKLEEFDFGRKLAVGLLLLESKQFEPAAEYLDLAVKAKPKQAAEVLLSWGIVLLTNEKYAEAAAVFKRGVDEQALTADNPVFQFYLAGALELAGQTEEALKAARAAVAINKDSPRLHSRVAWVYYHAKRYAEAARSYGELIEKFDAVHTNPEVRQVLREARLALSNICVVQHNIHQAEEWLEQVLDEFPEDISALNDLGYLWADQGKNLDRALEMVKKAVAAEPESDAYLDSLGWTLYRLGRFDEALVELKKAADISIKDGEPDAVILDHLGDAYLKTGDAAQAVECWKRALQGFDKKYDADRILATETKLKSQSK